MSQERTKAMGSQDMELPVEEPTKLGLEPLPRDVIGCYTRTLYSHFSHDKTFTRLSHNDISKNRRQFKNNT